MKLYIQCFVSNRFDEQSACKFREYSLFVYNKTFVTLLSDNKF